MLVFWKARLVLLAVPKTGTSAYQTALTPHAGIVVSNPPELKHSPVYRYNRFFRPMFDKRGAEDMELMAVIREPVSWLGSWYRYRQRPFLDGKNTSTKNISFDDFVLAYCQDKKPAFANVGSQARFVEPKPDGAKVSYLFAYENQPAIISFLEARLSVKINLPHNNVSEKMQLTLTDQTLSLLHEKRPEEFEIWEHAKSQSSKP